MRIKLVLEVGNPQDVDEQHGSGLTDDAYDELLNALADAGYSIVSGPDVVKE